MDSNAADGVRWWRRNRDLAQQAARRAHADAAQVVADLERAEGDLTELSRIDATHDAERLGVEPRGHASALSGEWDAISVDTGTEALLFYELDAGYDPTADYTEPESRRYVDAFGAAADRIRKLLPRVEAFRDRYAGPLARAVAVREAAPELAERAGALVEEARIGLGRAAGDGLVAPPAASAIERASTLLEHAAAAAEARDWATAHRDATEALGLAEAAHGQVEGLTEQAARLRTSLVAVRTRREALQTRHEQLPEVMSALRRRYTLVATRSVDDVPAVVEAALRRADEGIDALAVTVGRSPLDVPAGAELLAGVRTSLDDADQAMRAAVDLLARLDAMAADPQRRLEELRHRLIDARRFLAARPAGERYATTLDALARRTDQLGTAVRAVRPDWGAVAAEADAIEAGLDAMITTARGR